MCSLLCFHGFRRKCCRPDRLAADWPAALGPVSSVVVVVEEDGEGALGTKPGGPSSCFAPGFFGLAEPELDTSSEVRPPWSWLWRSHLTGRRISLWHLWLAVPGCHRTGIQCRPRTLPRSPCRTGSSPAHRAARRCSLLKTPSICCVCHLMTDGVTFQHRVSPCVA